jgi:hypothetical protein
VNQTFDSQTLANAPCLIYPEESAVAEMMAGSAGFYPGMGLPYKESKEEYGILQFPKPEASSFLVVNFFQQIIERLTRIGPSRMGDVSEGRRVPATLGLSSQQIGGELIDEFIDRERDTWGRVLGRYFALIYTDQPAIFRSILGVEDGQLVEDIVRASIDGQRTLEETIRIRLSASSGTRSVELDRQNALANVQAMMTWYEKAIELVTLYTQAPEGPGRAILLNIMQSSEEQMRRLVEMSQQPDAGLIVPFISKDMEQIPPPPPPAPPTGPPGAPPGAPMPGMEEMGGMGGMVG